MGDQISARKIDPDVKAKLHRELTTRLLPKQREQTPSATKKFSGRKEMGPMKRDYNG